MDEAIRPEFARALEAHKAGDVAAAEAVYRDLYARAPHPKIAHMLALALYQRQRLDEALEWFERALASSAGTSLHVNYASALLAAGRAGEAEAQTRLALTRAPAHEGARLNLALALEAQQRFGAAAAAFEPLTSLPAVAAVARRGLARAFMHQGRLDEACEALAAADRPDDPETALVRAELALEKGQVAEARAALNLAVEANSTRVRAWVLQARLCAERGDGDGALTLLERAFAAEPQNRAALLQSTPLWLQRGEVGRCLERLQAWVRAHPNDADADSMYVRCAQYSSDFDAASLLRTHRAWAARHAVAPQFVAPRRRTPGDKLRIGWLSPAFRNGPVLTFFLATLRELEQRGLAENILYDCNPRREPSSAAFRAICPRWAEVAESADAALADRIRADAVDVLVDLAGHARGGRLAALAQRAAPVQATWLDSLGTTGIAAMDFILTDRVSTPPASERDFTESLLYLPRGRLCYEPPVPAQRPDLASRRLISLNHFAKLNDSVVAVWAQILRALPGWALCLKSRGGDDPGVVAALHSRFARHGIEPLRVECSGYASVPHALAAYRDAAIALDPFPFGGGANSCDALWLGLPLVTLPGDTLVSRQGASLLDALDRKGWIARDTQDYVAIAHALAADDVVRARWSEIAAARVRERLGDARAFAVDLIAAFEEAWRLRADDGFPAVSGKYTVDVRSP